METSYLYFILNRSILCFILKINSLANTSCVTISYVTIPHRARSKRGQPSKCQSGNIECSGRKKNCIVNIKNFDFFTDFAFLS